MPYDGNDISEALDQVNVNTSREGMLLGPTGSLSWCPPRLQFDKHRTNLKSAPETSPKA